VHAADLTGADREAQVPRGGTLFARMRRQIGARRGERLLLEVQQRGRAA